MATRRRHQLTNLVILCICLRICMSVCIGLTLFRIGVVCVCMSWRTPKSGLFGDCNPCAGLQAALWWIVPFSQLLSKATYRHARTHARTHKDGPDSGTVTHSVSKPDCYVLASHWCCPQPLLVRRWLPVLRCMSEFRWAQSNSHSASLHAS